MFVAPMWIDKAVVVTVGPFSGTADGPSSTNATLSMQL